jgi:hypothetical protein
MKSWIPPLCALFLVFFFEPYVSSGHKFFDNKRIKTMENNTYPVRLINLSIEKPASDVYRFASNPENFPKWVAFVKSIRKQGDIWIGETTLGTLRIKFSAANDFGVIDHDVTLPTGETIYNPMRVIANHNGCEFVFTLFRMPGRSDNEFEEDARAVTKDLQKLKEIMEKM